MLKDKIIQLYKRIVARYDYEPGIRYFNAADFHGLNAEPFEFPSNEGITLRGFIYGYTGHDRDRLVVFCHGIGPGHLSYMREIELLASSGFRVMAYDVTGTGMSGGKDIRSMTQSLADLDACIGYIRSRDDLKYLELSVIGHSWGGYAAGNILNYRKQIRHVVVISGFTSFQNILKQYLKGIAALLRGIIYRYEKELAPGYVDSSSEQAFADDDADFLIIHSADDAVVSCRLNAEYLSKTVKRSNVGFLLVDGKGHNPNYTHSAVSAMKTTFGGFQAELKRGNLKTDQQKTDYFKGTDWFALTEQDPDVWQRIIEHISAS